MAANALRFRRSLALASSILNNSRHFSSVTPSVAASPYSTSTTQQNPNLFNITQSKPKNNNNNVSYQQISSRSISSRARYNNNDDMDGDQISPDAILFEGCDYNHWLITMDFPKDPKPSPEEMVETYVQTAAKVLGSVEEAKKKIYACSTTTYNGFQVEVSEEVSERFQGLPGVVFVLPDSYIDPVNKEYGGDKYDNGNIIHRPPPVQYGRQGGRYNDRNRDYNRPPPRGQMEQNNVPGSYQGDRRGPMTSYQENYNQGDGRNVRQADFPRRDQGNFTPPPVGDYSQGGGGSFRQGAGGQYGQGRGGQFGQTGGGNYGQGAGGQYGQGGGGNYGQGTGGQYGQGGGAQYGQGGGGGGGSYSQGSGGQVSGGNYGQRAGGQYRQGSGGNYGPNGQYGQGVGAGSSNQTSPQYGENQSFSQRSNIGGQQGNYEVTEEADSFRGR